MLPPDELLLIKQTDSLKLSELVDSVKINYGIAFVNKTKLEFLQDWIRKQELLYSK